MIYFWIISEVFAGKSRNLSLFDISSEPPAIIQRGNGINNHT